MIIDLPQFIERERPYWDELERTLKHVEEEPLAALPLEKLERFHYLYERTSADLGKVNTFASEPEIRRYLEVLVARAYGEIHEVRGKPHRFDPLGWFFKTFPRTFRRHMGAFWIVVAVTLFGCVVGGAAIELDPDSRYFLLPYGNAQITPHERVRQEESVKEDRLKGSKASFAAFLQTHNIQVALSAFVLGASFGLGTLYMIFENGLMLGAIVVDFVRGGETPFLAGWLLPHGSFEIPAILLAGQAGLLLAGALIGWRKPLSLRDRLAAVSGDLLTLMGGVALMLLWAGFVESFLSQYHEPVLPYPLKIGFGCVELTLLISFLAFSGRRAGTVDGEGGDHGP
jgi:uncharacterized membrane protein SpoIIM required for sporulation